MEERLPLAVQESILARLPLEDLHNAGCVCKLWNAAIKSEHFRKLWSKQHCGEFFLLLFAVASRFVKAVDLRVEGKPAPIDFKGWFLQAPEQSVLASSSGGLILFRSQQGPKMSYTIANPLVKLVKNIPRPPAPTESYTNTCIVNHGDWYQVVVAGQIPSNKQNGIERRLLDGTVSYLETSIQVYSSRTNSWLHSRTSSVKLALEGMNKYAQFMVFFRGKIYCLLDMDCDKIGCFDIAQMKWDPEIISAPEGSELLCLTEYKGRLTVFVRSPKMKITPKSRMRFMFLDSTCKWVLIHDVPLLPSDRVWQVYGSEGKFIINMIRCDLDAAPTCCFMLYDLETKSITRSFRGEVLCHALLSAVDCQHKFTPSLSATP